MLFHSYVQDHLESMGTKDLLPSFVWTENQHSDFIGLKLAFPTSLVKPHTTMSEAPNNNTTPTYPKEQTEKKLIAGLLAILLGGLGIHKFYLGYTKEGIILIVANVFTCFTVVWLVVLIEGIIYLTKSDNEFVSTYVVGRKPWF